MNFNPKWNSKSIRAKQILPRSKTAVETGRDVEAQAVAFLAQESDIRLIARNFRKKFGELDLIGEELVPSGKLELVFIEVRFREAGGWVSGLESVSLRKRQRIEKAAQSFLMTYSGPAKSIRMDVMAFDGRGWIHCRGAW